MIKIGLEKWDNYREIKEVKRGKKQGSKDLKEIKLALKKA